MLEAQAMRALLMSVVAGLSTMLGALIATLAGILHHAADAHIVKAKRRPLGAASRPAMPIFGDEMI